MNLYSSVLIAATLLIAPGAIFYGHAQTAKQSPDANKALTLAANEDREIGTVEKLVVDAAEAMPVDRFNFSPERLEHPGRRVQGRTHICRRGQAHCHFQLLHVVGAHLGRNFQTD